MTKKKKPEDLLAKGQPTKYKPEFCQMLIEHMAKGFSYLAFCAIADVHHDSLYEWEQVHPDFSEAKRKALHLNRMFWENKTVEGFSDRYFNNTLLIFNMKNRFKHEWNDRSAEKTSIPFTPKEILEDE